MRLIRVAVPVPGLEALTYSVPEEIAPPVTGARVLVPLGHRVITGVVTGTAEDCSTAPPTGDRTAEGSGLTLKAIIDVLDPDPFLPEEVISLTAWVAEYYACGIGEAIAAAMPPRAWIEGERHVRITEAGHARLLTERGLRRRLLDGLVGDKPVPVGTLAGDARGARSALLGLERDGLVSISGPTVGTASGFRTVPVASLTAQGQDSVPDAAGNGGPSSGPGGESNSTAGASADDETADQSGRWTPGARQREALTLLRAAPDGIDTAELAARGIAAPTLKRLAALGLIALTRRRVERDPFVHAAARETAVQSPVTLTPEQSAAMSRLQGLAGAGAFSAVVLHGVTGSGKTELYLRLAQHVASSRHGVLVLVPEIALTPAVAGAFRATFGERVAIQHSGLSDGERHDQWHRIRRGDVDVVVGTRSAVFAPVQRLGLIIVDEEHDTSYKQEESPRYHGRDVAVVRARAAQALAVLGSATPSLESYHNAQSGRYSLITLERRVLDRPMATVRLVDMRAEYAAAGPDVVISTVLADAIRERLELGEQAIVLLNRRGFATSLFCRQCGGTLECPNCSVSLTVHRAARRARCHYCNHAMRIPTTCSKCAGTFLEQAGFGTERVEAELATLFPGARLARVDRDTVRRRGAITALLERFGAGHIDVLVGTQMIAKGHDFPRVTLVGVVSADVGLGLADFRAGERTFHLLTQVAGRAGRGEIAGEAVVQTIHPGHYSITHACRQDYAAFYREEISFRRAMKYPPTVALINAVVKGSTLEGALADAGAIVHALRWGGEPYRVLGPAPAPLSRLKGEHRAQLFIKGSHRSAMRKALQGVLDVRPDIRRRTIVDVDPMSVL